LGLLYVWKAALNVAPTLDAVEYAPVRWICCFFPLGASVPWRLMTREWGWTLLPGHARPGPGGGLAPRHGLDAELADPLRDQAILFLLLLLFFFFFFFFFWWPPYQL